MKGTDITMKTLIVYATKYGAAGEVARRIADRIGGAALHKLGEGAVPSPSEFDCVIIGSPLYAGMIRKEAKAFQANYADALKGKTIGLFLCGIDENAGAQCFEANFEPDILQAAKAHAVLGGIFDPKKANFFERFIMRAIAKHSAYINTINNDKINRFAEDMRE